MSDTSRFVDIGSPLDIRAIRQYLGKGVTGLTVFLTIQRASDDYYWDGTIWDAPIAVLTMDKVSDVTNPGEHRYDGPTPSVADTFNCHAYIPSGTYAFDDYEAIVAKAVVTGITQQQVRDAMSLSSTLLEPSIDTKLNSLSAQVGSSGVLSAMIKEIKAILANGASDSKIFYVDGNIAVPGDGLSWATAKATINDAVALTVDSRGDFIFTKPSIYLEKVVIKKSCRLIGSIETSGFAEIQGDGTAGPSLVLSEGAMAMHMRIGDSGNNNGLPLIILNAGSKFFSNTTGDIQSLVSTVIEAVGVEIEAWENIISGSNNAVHGVVTNGASNSYFHDNTFSDITGDVIVTNDMLGTFDRNNFNNLRSGKYAFTTESVVPLTLQVSATYNAWSGGLGFVHPDLIAAGSVNLFQNNEQWLHTGLKFMGTDDETVGDFFKRLNWAQVRPRNADIIAGQMYEFFYPVGVAPAAGGVGSQMKRKLKTYNNGVPTIASDDISQVHPIEVA